MKYILTTKVLPLLASFILIPSSFGSSIDAGKSKSGIPYTMVSVPYKKVNGRDILADVYTKTGERNGAIVVWIHGGGLIFGSRKWIPAGQLDRYLAAGYSVVAIDHRLSPEAKIAEIAKDVEDAYRWIMNEGASRFAWDTNRVAVVGHSSGGYLALVSGYQWEPRPKALVSIYGFGDITGDWSALPNPHFNEEPEIEYSEALAALGSDPVPTGTLRYEHEGRPKFFRYTKQQGNWLENVTGKDRSNPLEFSDLEPVRNVTSDFPPTLLIHGELDTDVPYGQSVAMAEVLRKEGVFFKTIINPEWEHLFDLKQPDNPKVEKALDELGAFLSRFLK